MRGNGDANCMFLSVPIPGLDLSLDRYSTTPHSSLTHLKDARFCLGSTLGSGRGFCGFACLSVGEKKGDAMRPRQRRRMGWDDGSWPTPAQLTKNPLSVVALVPRDAALFLAGAVAGAAAKTVTAPLDRIKLLMQTHGVRFGHEGAKKAMGFVEAITMIGKEEGIKGFWKGNLPQVIRIIPYSAVQLFAYEFYKKLLRGKDRELSVIGRLVAGHVSIRCTATTFGGGTGL